MRVLALDTTTPRGSLAVAMDEDVVAEARVLATQGHSRWVLGAAEALLAGLGVPAASVDGFAVTVGPGSFTGLRVGISTIQGLALAAGRPCAGLSTLDVLALSAAGAAPKVVALVDAFRGEVYAGLYDGSGRAREAARVGRLEALLGELEEPDAPTAFVGEAALGHREAIEARFRSAVFPLVDPFLAPTLAREAVRRLRRGEGTPAAALRPLYLRPPDVGLSRP